MDIDRVMAPEPAQYVPAKMVTVAKIWRAQCQVPGCNWWGSDQPSYQDANVQRLAHLEDHRNGTA